MDHTSHAVMTGTRKSALMVFKAPASGFASSIATTIAAASA